MAYEQYLTLYNTGENKLINRAYKDSVFVVEFANPDILDQIIDGGADISTIKYELIIVIDGVRVATLKSPTGYFHIEQVIQDYTRTDSQGYAKLFASHLMPQSKKDSDLYSIKPHSIHEINAFACNRDNLIQVEFLVGMSLYNSDLDTFYASNPQPVKGSKYIYDRYYYWNAVQQHYNIDRDVTDYTDYILDGDTKNFLTNQDPRFKRKVRLQDYQTLAFFNGKFCESANQNHGVYVGACDESIVKYIYCILYDANDSIIVTGRIENNEANGGSYNPLLDSPNYIPPNWLPADRGLLYVGVGPNNIIDNYDDVGGGTITSADFDNCVRYEIFATGSAGLGAIYSDLYNFEMQVGDCKDYETIRLAYLNRQGAWDYMNFTKKSTNTTEITRSNYKENYGITPITYTGTTKPKWNKWDYDSSMGGTRTYNVNAIVTIEANTDWLTEDDAIYMEELFTSPDVYMQNTNNEFEPVVVTESDYTKQTKANDKLIQYVISIQKGHETRVQRL